MPRYAYAHLSLAEFVVNTFRVCILSTVHSDLISGHHSSQTHSHTFECIQLSKLSVSDVATFKPIPMFKFI